jgi:hypothetical protein
MSGEYSSVRRWGRSRVTRRYPPRTRFNRLEIGSVADSGGMLDGDPTRSSGDRLPTGDGRERRRRPTVRGALGRARALTEHSCGPDPEREGMSGHGWLGGSARQRPPEGWVRVEHARTSASCPGWPGGGGARTSTSCPGWPGGGGARTSTSCPGMAGRWRRPDLGIVPGASWQAAPPYRRSSRAVRLRSEGRPPPREPHAWFRGRVAPGVSVRVRCKGAVTIRTQHDAGGRTLPWTVSRSGGPCQVPGINRARLERAGAPAAPDVLSRH